MSHTPHQDEHPSSGHDSDHAELPPPDLRPAPGERTIASFKGRLLIGAVLLLGALIYFGYTAFQGSTVYYLTVGELVSQQPRVQNKAVRVSGKLVTTSFHRDTGSTLAIFDITDGQKTLKAKYDGVVPDLFFNEHSDIVLQGVYGGDGVFHTDNVIVKCPSKYIEATPETPTTPGTTTH